MDLIRPPLTADKTRVLRAPPLAGFQQPAPGLTRGQSPLAFSAPFRSKLACPGIRSQRSVSRVRHTIRRVNRMLKPKSDVPTFTESRH